MKYNDIFALLGVFGIHARHCGVRYDKTRAHQNRGEDECRFHIKPQDAVSASGIVRSGKGVGQKSLSRLGQKKPGLNIKPGRF